MPKAEVKKIVVNKKLFLAVINAKGYSIRKLCELYLDDSDMCSDRTLRRSLDSGKIRAKYIDAIAKIIDVDPRYLTGEIRNIDPKLKRVDKITVSYYISLISHYPYSRKELDELQHIAIKDHLTNVLSLFDFSYKQFETMDFETQFNFQHELFESIVPVLAKYFKEDGYGNKERPALDTLILSLENYYETECELQYADTTLREKFVQSPPDGYTSTQIKKMSRDQLLDLDLYLQWKDYVPTPEDIEFEKRMEEKYHISSSDKR